MEPLDVQETLAFGEQGSKAVDSALPTPFPISPDHHSLTFPLTSLISLIPTTLSFPPLFACVDVGFLFKILN